MFKKLIVSLFFITISLYFPNTVFGANIPSQFDDSSLTSNTYGSFIEYLGTGLDQTITSLEIKVKLIGDGNWLINNVGLFNSSSANSRGSRITGYSAYSTSPSECLVNGYIKWGSYNESCPSDTIITYYWAFTTPPTLNPNWWYYLVISTTPTGSIQILGKTDGDNLRKSLSILCDLNDWNNATYCVDDTGVGTSYLVINGEEPPPADPTGAITAETVNLLNKTITLSAEFDFIETGEGYFVNGLLYRLCELSTGELKQDITPYARIHWAADDDITTTIITSPSTYDGAGYTDIDSTASFSGVTVPYTAGADCTYPLAYNVYNADSELVYSSTTELTNIELIPEDATSLYESPAIEATQEGLFSGIITWFSDFVDYYLGFSQVGDDIAINLNAFQTALNTKAPFGYINSVLDFSPTFTTNAELEKVPNLNIPLDSGYAVYTDININFPNELDTIMGTIRTVFKFMIWLLFLGYLFHLTTRIKKE